MTQPEIGEQVALMLWDYFGPYRPRHNWDLARYKAFPMPCELEAFRECADAIVKSLAERGAGPTK